MLPALADGMVGSPTGNPGALDKDGGDDGDAAGRKRIPVVSSLGRRRRASHSGPEDRTRRKRSCAIFAGTILSGPSRTSFVLQQHRSRGVMSKCAAFGDGGEAGVFPSGPIFAFRPRRSGLPRQSGLSESNGARRLPLSDNDAALCGRGRGRIAALMRTPCPKGTGGRKGPCHAGSSITGIGSRACLSSSTRSIRSDDIFPRVDRRHGATHR